MIKGEDLKRQAASALILLSFKRFFLQIVYTVSNVILARILFPSDFGTFGVIASLGTVLTLLTDVGLVLAIIQKKEKLKETDINTVFTFQTVLSLFVVMLLFFCAPLISSFYNLSANSVLLIRIYSLTFLFGPYRTISEAVMERNLNYRNFITVEIGGTLFSSLATVIFAYFKFGVFSFAYGMIVGSLVGTLINILINRLRVSLAINKQTLFSLMRFGFPYQTNVVFGIFYGPLIMLYLGKKVGPESLGFFQFAASLSVLPLALSEIVNRVVFPVGSRLQSDKNHFRILIEKSCALVSFTTLPTFFFMVILAPYIIHYVYTDKWLPSLPALYIGLLQMAVISYTGVFSQLILALGKSKSIRNMSIFWAGLTWLIGPFLINKLGFIGMSLTSLIVFSTGIYLFFVVKKELKFSFSKIFLPFFLSALFSGLVLFLLTKALPLNIFVLIFAVLVSGVVYLLLIYFMERKFLLSNLATLSSIILKTK